MKHVLITGGSDGLGKVTASKLIKAGYKITILANNEFKTKQAAKELGCDYVVADVSNIDRVKKAFVQAGPVDILINNAASWEQGPLESNNPKDIKRLIDVNVFGVINCTRQVVGEMKRRKAGKIINLSSQGGLYAKADRSVYNTSKFAVTGFTRAMQAEMKPYNVSVIGIFPGAIKNTNMFSHHKEHRDMTDALKPEYVADAIVNFCNLPDGITVTEFGIDSLAY